MKEKVNKVSKAGSYKLHAHWKKTQDSLAGRGRIILQCSINNTRIPILMAARAQVTINEERYLRENFPHLKINPVKDLL